MAPPGRRNLSLCGGAQRGKQRLQAEDGDLRTEREKLLAELRALRDGAKGPLDMEALTQRINECGHGGGARGAR